MYRFSLFVVALALASVLARAEAPFDTAARYFDAKARIWAPERAALHDHIADLYLPQINSVERPNLIFSAGGLGAGKTTVLKALSELGFLNLDEYFWSDPDRFKPLVPEYADFLAQDPERASTLVHFESGWIAQNITLRALAQKKNIIIDGTLKDTEYFKRFIAQVRRDYPAYSIAIIFVDANEQTLLARVEERAKITDRHAPISVVVDSKRRVGESVAKLEELVDTTIRIENEENPVVHSFSKNGESVSLELQLPLVGGHALNFALEMPTDTLAAETGLQLNEEIRGVKQVVEVSSGSHFDDHLWNTQFLAQLPAHAYWIVVRENDPHAVEILRGAQHFGFESIVIGEDAFPHSPKLGELCSYLITVPSAEKLWDELVVPAANGTPHLRLDFQQPLSLVEESQKLQAFRESYAKRLATELSTRGIRLVREKEFKDFVAGKTPVFISGASRDAWLRADESSRTSLVQSIAELFAALDPHRVLIISDGTSRGLDAEVHRLARKNGLSTLAPGALEMTAADYGDVDAVSLLANSWFGRARGLMKFLHDKKAPAIFVGGGGALRREITMAQQWKVPYHLATAIPGTAASLAIQETARAFNHAGELRGHFYREHAQLLRPEARRSARDALYEQMLGELRRRGDVAVVDEAELQHRTLGYGVTVIGGYSGLGYTDPAILRAEVEALVRAQGDHQLYVLGGTRNGIGEALMWIPELAKRLGWNDIKTASIVSRDAAKYEIPAQDYIVFTDTRPGEWNDQDGALLPRVRFAQAVKGNFVFFRGGQVMTVELAQALEQKLPVRIVVNPALTPEPGQTMRRLVSQPSSTVDGTSAVVAEHVKEPGRYPTLQVLTTFIPTWRSTCEARLEGR